MRNVLNSIILVSTILSGTLSFAAGEFSLKDLDKLQTCAPGTIQEKNGQMALDFLEAFVWWNAKDQLNMVGDDYIAWHASLAGLLESAPQYRGHVPFDKGQWTKKTYVETLSFLAYANDLSQYKVKPTRVDCVGDDSVVLLADFTGAQLRREEATGCPTHGLAFGSRTHIDVTFKNYSAVAPGGPSRRLVSRTYSHLDDLVSANVRLDLAKIVGDPKKPNASNIPHNPANCKSRAQVLKEFQDQVNN